jgi:hypothetical protein
MNNPENIYEIPRFQGESNGNEPVRLKQLIMVNVATAIKR